MYYFHMLLGNWYQRLPSPHKLLPAFQCCMRKIEEPSEIHALYRNVKLLYMYNVHYYNSEL